MPTEVVTKIMVVPDGMSLDDPDVTTFAVYVEWRGPRSENGSGGYAVTMGGFRQLSRAGNWGSPQPFQYRQYRWETVEEALEWARKVVNDRKVNGRTFAEWQELEFPTKDATVPL